MDQSKVLVGIPPGLRDPLLQSYEEIGANFAEHRWEPSELNGGKFCEVVYTIVHGTLHGSFPSKPSKPSNMVDACRALERITPDSSRVGDRSLRILIPRMLLALYEVRNNRGVGHIGGDVDPNFMDAIAVYSMSSWTLAELVRIFHGITTQEAQETVDVLVERKLTLIWQIDSTRRVQDPKMKKGEQTLVLLYSKPGWIREADLHKWVEYSSEAMFRKNILRPYHQQRLIEYEEEIHRARISPLGSKKVEDEILKTRTKFPAI
jgi:hypothetical protein